MAATKYSARDVEFDVEPAEFMEAGRSAERRSQPRRVRDGLVPYMSR